MWSQLPGEKENQAGGRHCSMRQQGQFSLGSRWGGPLELAGRVALVAALDTKTLHPPGGRILSWLIQWIGQPPPLSSRSFGSPNLTC